MNDIMKCPQCSQQLTQVGKFWVCPEHGQVTVPHVEAAAEPDGTKLFVSYGRRDTTDLVRRLRADLTERGYRVWQDLVELVGGQDWAAEVQRAIHDSDIVLAVLSPHAVRKVDDASSPDSADSVCLDEIACARFSPPIRPIVPLMAIPCEPPLSIYRLEYVDFSDWQSGPDGYEAGLGRVLDALAAARSGDVRYRSWDAHLRPWDFGAFLDEKRSGFLGREWLFEAMDDWLEQAPEQTLLITGDPGVGKSAIVAEIVYRNSPALLAYHCCQADTPATLRPDRFVRSIAGMIASRLEPYAAQIADSATQGPLAEQACRDDPASAFEAGILSPLRHLPAPDDGLRYILIDALDEALLYEGNPTIVEILATRLGRLPPWLRLAATTRKDRSVLELLRGLRSVELDAQSPANLTDVETYVRRHLSPPSTGLPTDAETGVEALVHTIVEKSEGNFLYLQTLFEGVQKGDYRLSEVGSLPPGLQGQYLMFLRRRFPNVAAFAPARLVLETIVAAQEPVAEGLLIQATGLDPEYELPGVLRGLDVFLCKRDGTLELYHRSFKEWLTLPSSSGAWHHISTKQGHRMLADVGWAQYQSGGVSPYFVAHLDKHLREAGRGADAATILRDPTYLEQRRLYSDLIAASSGMVDRQAITDQIDYWLENGACQHLLIVGGPGTGKTVLCARMALLRREMVAGVHFCRMSDDNTTSPASFVRALVSQLRANIPGYGRLLEQSDADGTTGGSADAAFLRLVVDPLSQVALPDGPRMIIVDGLDEASCNGGVGIAHILLLAERLPSWLRVLVTTRPEATVLSALRGWFRIDLEKESATEDVRAYIEHRLNEATFATIVASGRVPLPSLVDLVAERSEGNFLAAKMVLDGISEGSVSVDELGRLAAGISSMYEALLGQRFPDVNQFQARYRPVLQVVAEQGPVSASQIAEHLGWDGGRTDEAVRGLGTLLRETDGKLDYFHLSLRDWLTDAKMAGGYWCRPRDASQQSG